MTARLAVVVMLVIGSAALGTAAPRAQGAAATIAGVIVSSDSPAQPVRRAIVTLTGGALTSNLSTVADEDGRFRFVDLPPGRYNVNVSKASYLPMAYGASQPGRPGTSIAVAAGQKLDIRIVLPRGAVITGTVRDHSGQPAPGIQVTVSRANDLNTLTGFLVERASLLTDDRGVFRAYGLMPGDYVVFAVPRLIGSGDVFRMTQAEVEARERALRARTGDVAAATVAAPAATARDGQLPPIATPLGYAPTYYPGTVDGARAERIRVAAGEERAAVDIPLWPVRVARVSGVLQGGTVAVERLQPTLNVVGPSPTLFDRPLLTGPTADGAFTFTGVTPGRYTLMARSGPGAMMRMTEGRGSTTNNPGVSAQYAMADVTVDGNDITGVILTLEPALTVSGRIVFEGTTLKPPPNLTGLRLTLTPVTADGSSARIAISEMMGGSTTVPATINADGTFEMIGVVPGTYALVPSVPPAQLGTPPAVPGAAPVAPSTGPPANRAAAGPGWWMRSAMANGRDLLDGPLVISAGMASLSDAVITFTDRRSGIQGTLTTAAGQPASEYVVIAFPVDRTQWRPGARRLKTARPGSDGAFSLTELPAGEYFLAALTDLDPDQWQQATFLDHVVPAAVKVVIAEGERTRQDLRIAK